MEGVKRKEDKEGAEDIFGSITQLRKALDLSSAQKKDLQPRQQELLAGLKGDFSFIHQELLSRSATELSAISLDRLYEIVTAIKKCLSRFFESKDSYHVDVIETELAIELQRTLEQILPIDKLVGLYVTSAASWRRAVKRPTGDSPLLNAERAALAQLLTSAGQAEKRLSTLSDAVAKKSKEVETTLAAHQASFLEREAIRSTEHERDMREAKAAWDRSAGETALRMDELLTELAKYRDQAKEILGVIADDGVTSEFKATAIAESKQADDWRTGTMIIFSVAVLVALFTVAQHWNQPVNAEVMYSVVIRFVFALLLTTPAWYTARESARHRTNADRARQSALELAALGPFLDAMEPAARLKIRESLVPTYFGNRSEPHEIVESQTIDKLIAVVHDLAKTTGKAVKTE